MEDLDEVIVSRLRREITKYAQQQIPNSTSRAKGKSLLLRKIRCWAEEQQIPYQRDVPLSDLHKAPTGSLLREGNLDIVLDNWIDINVTGNNNPGALADLHYAAQRSYLPIWIQRGVPHTLDVPSPVHRICLAPVEQPVAVLLNETSTVRPPRFLAFRH